MKKTTRFLLFATALLQLAACQVNPVTGERHFQIYGSDWEQQVGAQMYSPLKQSQGGELILDPGLTAYVNEVGGRLAANSAEERIAVQFSILNLDPQRMGLAGGQTRGQPRLAHRTGIRGRAGGGPGP
jgi:predicted Zn-dependent protease